MVLRVSPWQNQNGIDPWLPDEGRDTNGRIESQREGAVESHISRKTSETWGTRPSSGDGRYNHETGSCAHASILPAWRWLE